jgi:hypothetical protein
VSRSESDPYSDAELVLRSALGDDREALAGTVSDVVDRTGVSGAFDVAVCLAATMVGEGTRAGGWILEFPDIDEAAYDARWVARFVSAYVNSDPSTGRALFGAALADGQLPDCLVTLAGSTLATLRRRA